MNKITKMMSMVVLSGALTGVSAIALADGGYEYKPGMNGHSEQDYWGQKKQHKSPSCLKKGGRAEPSAEKRQAMMQLRVEDQLEHLTVDLGLTHNQQIQVREILKKSEFIQQQIRQETRMKINQVLAPQQRPKVQNNKPG